MLLLRVVVLYCSHSLLLSMLSLYSCHLLLFHPGLSLKLRIKTLFAAASLGLFIYISLCTITFYSSVYFDLFLNSFFFIFYFVSFFLKSHLYVAFCTALCLVYILSSYLFVCYVKHFKFQKQSCLFV